MQIVRSVVIDAHIEDVFDYVADPLNDVAWRPGMLLVDQIEGDGPGLGARYEMLCRPGRSRRARPVAVTCVDWDPPDRIAWTREAAGRGPMHVSYELAPLWTATRLTHRHELGPGRPRILGPAIQHAAARDVDRQLRALRGRFEQR
jgi:uncharacterized protein YndB with AHSA1/START domain